MPDYRYEWIWDKPHTGFLNANCRPLGKHEHVLVFCAQKTVPYFRQTLEGKAYRRWIGAKASTNYGAQKARGGVVERAEGGRCPTSILSYNHDRERLHPTQKPVALLEFLIRTYTAGPGAVVLDNTMGSGSTGVACARTGRRFVGMELEARMFAIAERRIRTAYQDPEGAAAPVAGTPKRPRSPSPPARR